MRQLVSTIIILFVAWLAVYNVWIIAIPMARRFGLTRHKTTIDNFIQWVWERAFTKILGNLPDDYGAYRGKIFRRTHS